MKWCTEWLLMILRSDRLVSKENVQIFCFFFINLRLNRIPCILLLFCFSHNLFTVGMMTVLSIEFLSTWIFLIIHIQILVRVFPVHLFTQQNLYFWIWNNLANIVWHKNTIWKLKVWHFGLSHVAIVKVQRQESKVKASTKRLDIHIGFKVYPKLRIPSNSTLATLISHFSFQNFKSKMLLLTTTIYLL